MKKRILSLTLAAVMATGLAACGGGSNSPTNAPATNAPTANTQGDANTPAPANNGGDNNTPAASDGIKNPNAPMGTKGQGKYTADGYRIIRIAGWYDIDYYTDSTKQTLDSLTNYQTAPESYEKRFEVLKAVEEKYKVRFEHIRTTFEGIQVSLDEGVLSGRPEADIYEADVQFGIPAALNGQVYAIEDLTTADSDVFTTQQVFVPLSLKPATDKTFLFAVYGPDETVYHLGFNWTLLQAKGLENPQDLWDKGEWTWDKLKEYCVAMTDMTANPPVYGFTGLWTNDFDMFMRSNGAQVAATPEGGLLTGAMGEVLNLFKELYVDLKVARPWNSDDWEVNNRYIDGTAAFFTAANWIFNSDSSNYGGGVDYPSNYEFGVVPWPVGPSGNVDTNYYNYVQGSQYVIPKGVEDPATVYAAFFELRNWYDGDYQNTYKYDVIDPDDVPMTWTVEQLTAAAHGNETLAANSVRFNDFMMHRVSFDPWTTLSMDGGDAGAFSMVPIMNGEMTPAQFQETFKQPLADALRTFYGN